MSRLKIAVVGLLYWCVFSTGALCVMLGQLIDILAYVLTGSESRRDWVTKTGKGTDALNNAAWCDGDQRETISSHAGRYLKAYLNNKIDRVPLWVQVVDYVTSIFDPGHCIDSIEDPFVDAPL